VNNPNVSKSDIEKLLVGAVEFQALDDKFNKLKVQFGAIGGLIRTQFDRLRNSGARLDQESSINQLLNGEGI
jgi:hypothetical protein